MLHANLKSILASDSWEDFLSYLIGMYIVHVYKLTYTKLCPLGVGSIMPQRTSLAQS